jgi:dehydrogenase/reductase SDR family protein 4
MFDINVKSVFFLIKEALPLLKKGQKGKNILLISSVTGTNPSISVGVYAMTKAAIDNMVKWLS